MGPSSSSNPVLQRTFASRTHPLRGYSVCAPGFVVAMGVHGSDLSPRENSAASLLPAKDRPGGMGHSGLPGGSCITSSSPWGSPSAGPGLPLYCPAPHLLSGLPISRARTPSVLPCRPSLFLLLLLSRVSDLHRGSPLLLSPHRSVTGFPPNQSPARLIPTRHLNWHRVQLGF